jgi:6-phosphogluconolactonase
MKESVMVNRKILLVLVLLLPALGTSCGNTITSSASHLLFASLPSVNGVATVRVNNKSGEFTTVVGSPFSAGISPGAILLHPSNKFLYALNQGGNDISLFSIDQTSGSLTEVQPRTPTAVGPVSMAMNSGGTELFVSGNNSNRISVYSIGGSGALSEISGSPFTSNPNPTEVVLSPSGSLLFVLNPSLNAVSVYAVASGGALQQVANSPFPVGNVPDAVAISPDGKFLFVANSADNTISVLSINSTTGALTSASQSPFVMKASETVPVAFAVAPSGALLYVANFNSNNIGAFNYDTTTGVLTEVASSPFTGSTNPTFLAIDSTKTFLFVANQGSKSITEFTFGSQGGLNPTTLTATFNIPPFVVIPGN